MRRSVWAIAAVLVIGGAMWLRLLIAPLKVSVPHSTLHMGETVPLQVTRRTWFGSEPLAHPEKTRYITNWESMAVVEPDGSVTAIGTWRKPEETTTVTALNDGLRGEQTLSLKNEGPGPTLDLIVEAPPMPDLPIAACCSVPVRVFEGQQVRFRLLRHDAQHTDVTRRSAGTEYTLFFGSEVPNDPNAAQVVGYGAGINPRTFQLDDEHGLIKAPPSIGHLNHYTVLVFARFGNEIGWKQVQLAHAPAPGDKP